MYGLEPLFLFPYHARHAVQGFHRFLLQVFIWGDPEIGDHEKADCRDDEEHEDKKPDAAGRVLRPFQQAERLRAAQKDQRNRGEDTEHDAKGDPPGIVLLDLQEGVGFFHPDGSDGTVRSAFLRRFRLPDIVFQQVISADAEQFRQLDDPAHIRDGLRAFPFGNSLTADVQFFRQFFL